MKIENKEDWGFFIDIENININNYDYEDQHNYGYDSNYEYIFINNNNLKKYNIYYFIKTFFQITIISTINYIIFYKI